MIDLHVHSTASDGTLTPSQLAEKGSAFAVMALTDHDNMDGAAEFVSVCRQIVDPKKLRLPGVELSVAPGVGYKMFHLLGIGLDPDDGPFKAFLRRILAGRHVRNQRIIANFARIGITIPEDEIAGYAHGEVLARPHFAAWLVDHGYATDRKTAFTTYLTRTSPTQTRCYETRYHPDPAEAIALIHAAHGVAVMAHPRFWTDDPEMLRVGLRRLKDVGLDGIEAEYKINKPEETIEYLRVAKELDLAVTAGSDFHGANKPDIALGMEVADEKAFLAPLLRALEKWA